MNRTAYLDAFGIKQWNRRELSFDESIEHEVNDFAEDVNTKGIVNKKNYQTEFKVSVDDIQDLNLNALAKHVSLCQTCSLHKTRKQIVFGTGHHKADWLIIGEAPGADEDRQGEPFVGRAGQLLTQMLRAIGLAREEVFIANILKCRPPNNRDPLPEEVQACSSYLHRQIELLEPKIILALGRIAAQSLLQVDTPIGKMRGRLYTLDKFNIPTIVTYHPAYLLRSPKEKRKVWEDLKFARQQAFSL
ncbi:MAG: uracil-DNA glycosylase [Pseudomonadota bacterium]